MTWQEPTEEEIWSAPRVNSLTFYEALCWALGAVEPAGEGADPGPLADYVASDQPLTRNDRLMLADFIRMLPVRQMRGNPLNAPNIEIRAAALRVDLAKKQWRRENDKKNVPRDVTNGFIADAIASIAEQRGFAIPARSGLYANLERRIRTALTSWHF